MYKISFGSDNHSGVHQQVFDAMLAANNGYCSAYGDDPLSLKMLAQIEALFGGNCEAWFVMTGTGANVLSLQTLLKSYNAIICAATAHINVDECGAVQKFTQARLTPLETLDGKLTPELIAPRLLGDRDQHHSQFKVVSISQSTEYGTLYTLEELRTLADYVHANSMLLYMDGARLANAAVALNCSLKEMTTDVGVDMLSFGGTKNGLMFGEAIISLKPELTSDLRFFRKQATQLISKMRYIAAQYEAYLEGDLWRHNALHANRMACLLAKRLQSIPQLTVTQEVTVNSIFVILPEKLIAPLQEKYHFYTWDEARNEVRLMCSFNTTEEHIEELIATIMQLLQ
ncbi:MAG: low specificity L-threonine aldolase [Candidatus Cloacimonas sp.]|jgi:threonine aldolase|nr:low specificity L-threonine aldolase [Candidatus Cloacimonas sp.]